MGIGEWAEAASVVVLFAAGTSTTFLLGTTFDKLFSGGRHIRIYAADQAGTPNVACGDLGDTQVAQGTVP